MTPMPSPRPSPRRPTSVELVLARLVLSPRQRVARWHPTGWPTLLLAGVVLAAAFLVATAFSTGPVAPVGAVQGAGESPRRSTPEPARTDAPKPAAVVGPAVATPRPRATPAPTPPPTSAATPAPTPAPPETLTGYQWPLPRGRLTLPFGPSPWGSRIVDGERFHDGIDLATFCGDRIVAAHSGTVLAAGRRFDDWLGWMGDLQPYTDRLDRKKLWTTLPIVVVIDDGNGYRSVYAHFRKVAVKPGQVGEAGELLGWEGATGRASGCHLHYGLFSPLETATFEIDPKVTKRLKLPERQIARVDPMLVFPERP